MILLHSGFDKEKRAKVKKRIKKYFKKVCNLFRVISLSVLKHLN